MREGARVGRRAAGAALLVALGACAPTTANLACTAGAGRALPEALLESSGAAWSSRDPGVFWTHNDGRDGVLYAIDTLGVVRARVETEGPRLWDVEDLAGGPCPEGYCLYLADTGDNGERRESVSVYRVPEPALDATSVPRTRFPMRFPGGPRDVEALVVLPGEELLLLSKGRSEAVTVYRHPGPLIPDSLVTLERVNAVDPRRPSFAARVSGGSAVPKREDLVLIRSYERLILLARGPEGYRRVADGSLNLLPLQEAQGEAVAVRADGRVVLTSEAGPLSPVPGFHLLQCTFPPRNPPLD